MENIKTDEGLREDYEGAIEREPLLSVADMEVAVKDDLIAWKLVFIIVVPIVGFLLLGLWVDKLMATKHLFLIIGFMVGFIISIYGAYRMLLPLIKNKK